MASEFIPISTGSLTLTAHFFALDDGDVWNGSAFVDPHGELAATIAEWKTALSEIKDSANAVTIGYELAIPAGITVPVRIAVYSGAGTSETWGGTYDPQIAQILEDTGTTLDTKLNTIDDYVDSEITAIKTVTDKLNTTLVLDGAVYDFTAAALAAAPSGSGLDAAGVRSAIGMATADLDNQLDAILAATTAVTGDGAFTVVITVVDQVDAAVENAFVRVTLGATSYTGFTNASGEVSFSCDAGTWTVGITAPGYNAFTPATLVISDDVNQEYNITAATTVADTFAEAQDLYDMFGEANVKEWANMEELSTTDPEYSAEITRRINAALLYGTEEIKEVLRDGPYEEEFTTVPNSIKRCCCMKAGSWLFEWRRDDDENDRYSRMEERANKLLEQIKRGARQFDSSIQTVKGTRAPGVV